MQNRPAIIIILLLLILLGGGIGGGAFFYLKNTHSPGFSWEEGFSLADQRYKEARDLEVQGELTLSRLNYTQARDLYARQGDQYKLNLANAGIARTLGLAQDYSLDAHTLNNLLRTKVLNYRSHELANWESRGMLDFLMIDGQKRYLRHSLDNLVMLNPDLANRIPGWLEARSAAVRDLAAYVLASDRGDSRNSYRHLTSFLVKYRLVVETSSVPAYQTIKCWLPYPLSSPGQDSSLVSFSPPGGIKLAPLVEGEVGLVYAEIENTSPGPLNIELVYELRTKETNKKIEPEWAGSYDPDSLVFKQYTRSEPHLEISELVKKTAGEIVGEEANPARQARLIYDWVFENIRLQEVSYPLVLGSSASHQALEKKRGDSALQAFLFTALCRSQGIPARVVGGYRLIPGAETPAVWAEFLLPNQGWIPVDPGTAQLICLSQKLSAAEKKKVEDYYFGNLDPLRVSFNQSTLAPLHPPKLSERNLSLLLLQPELECGAQNLPSGAVTFTLTATRP